MPVQEDAFDFTEGAANGNQEPDAAALLKVIETLRPLSAADRLRTVEAALRFVGTTWSHNLSSSETDEPNRPTRRQGNDGVELPRRAQVWLSQNGLSAQDVAEVFHITARGVELIVNQVPGRTVKEQTLQCYLLCGVRGLMEGGEACFADDEARSLCRLLGCLDAGNHSANVRAIGNLMTGSKTSGYQLTQPGLRSAAELLRTMASRNGQ